MAEIIKTTLRGIPAFIWVLMTFSMLLFVVSFICPPTGVIDGSVLKAVSILIGGSAGLVFINNLPEYLNNGARIKAKASMHDGLAIEMSKKDNKDNKEN